MKIGMNKHIIVINDTRSMKELIPELGYKVITRADYIISEIDPGVSTWKVVKDRNGPNDALVSGQYVSDVKLGLTSNTGKASKSEKQITKNDLVKLLSEVWLDGRKMSSRYSPTPTETSIYRATELLNEYLNDTRASCAIYESSTRSK